MRTFKLFTISIIFLSFFSCEKQKTYLTEKWEKGSDGEYWYQSTWKRTDTYKEIYLDLSAEYPVFCGMGGNPDNVDIGSVDWNSDRTEGYFYMEDKISGTEAKMKIEKTDDHNLVLSLVDISTGEPYSPGYYTKSDGWCD